MVISPPLNYTFVSTLKCGTNSLFTILVEQFQGVRVGDFHCRDMRYALPGSFTFTTCRNPYYRAVSIWWSTCMRGHDRYGFRRACGSGDDFETFIAWVASLPTRPALLQNQTEWQRGIAFDRILHLEKLAREFSSLPFVEETAVELPRINTTLNNRLPAQHYLTPAAIESIRLWAEPDFSNFQYSMDVPSLDSLDNPEAGQC